MNEDLNRALALHRAGKLDDAEKIYQFLYQKNENDSSIIQLLGTIYLQKKNYSLSEKYLLNLSSSFSNLAESSGASFFRVILGQISEYC